MPARALNDADLHASLLNASAADAASYKASKRDWTAKTAVAYCEAMGTDYAVAEGGAAGPTFRPKGLDSGFSAIAVAARSPDGIKVVRQTLCESPHARRGDNMERFATAAARELLAAATGDGLDRCAGDRDDAEAIASYAARSDASYVVCDGGKALFEADGKLERLARADAARFGDVATATFLGTLDGAPLFAVDATRETDDARFRDTRVHGHSLSFAENQVALAATALVTWKRRSGFCSICGGPCTLGQRGPRADLREVRHGIVPALDPAMICAVSNRANDKILLARSPRHPEGVMTTLAGFVEAGETFEGVRRARGAGGDGRPHRRGLRALPQVAAVAVSAELHGRVSCTADCDQELVLDDELLEARWWDRSAVRKACGVPGAVMSPDVAKEAFATDPSLELLVPPKKVVARELIGAWLSEDDT